VPITNAPVPSPGVDNEEFFLVHVDPVLIADKAKALAHDKDEIFDVRQDFGFELAFVFGVGFGNEIH
jgi:hypothetical protein